VQAFGLPFVIAINRFTTDTAREIKALTDFCDMNGYPVSLTEVWAKGGEGGLDLAEKVLYAIESEENHFSPLYDVNEPIPEKIRKIAQIVYGAKDVEFSSKAQKQIKQFMEFGWDKLPICMAKTQYSLSDDPAKLGRPTDFTITVREFKPSIGAGFLVALTGDVMTMPGLLKQPAALRMDVDKKGNAVGLF
jgi:formyltetrahydrofolate synthetase